MDIAIIEPKIKSKFWRMFITILLLIISTLFQAIYLGPILDIRMFMLIVVLSFVLLSIIISKMINAYKVIGTIELNNDHWIISKEDLRKEILIQDIKKIYFKANLGTSKSWDGNTSYIANIIFKNNESYTLEISREEIKNGKLLSTNIFNMNSRFDLFKYLKKKRIKYDW